MKRPGRPFGVSLAIVASTFLYTLLPLLQIGTILLVRQHFLNIQFGDEVPNPIAMGGDFLGVPESNLILQGALSLGFLMIAILAWRGRPSIIGFVLVVAVFGLTLVKLFSIVLQTATDQGIQAGFSSLDSVMQSLATGQLTVEVLVMLYVIWYINRGPARAFYRGYYLPEPSGSVQSEGST